MKEISLRLESKRMTSGVAAKCVPHSATVNQYLIMWITWHLTGLFWRLHHSWSPYILFHDLRHAANRKSVLPWVLTISGWDNDERGSPNYLSWFFVRFMVCCFLCRKEAWPDTFRNVPISCKRQKFSYLVLIQDVSCTERSMISNRCLYFGVYIHYTSHDFYHLERGIWKQKFLRVKI